MWGYYGSKSKIINHYPSPQKYRIIEPFAGTAQYSLKYWNNEITLVDKYDIIIKLWKYLQQSKPSDILNIRKLKCGENVDNFDWDCEEQKWLVGFIITGAPSSPKKTASVWKTVIRPNTQSYKLKFIANNLYKIKDWEFRQGSYESINNEDATWFIDPPYQIGGQYYKFGNADIDYTHLSKWCIEREGQVIVCEKTGSNWLPFKHLISSRGNLYQHEEAIWTNQGCERT